MSERVGLEYWETVENYIDFLSDTLIPDLKESGYKCTAEDFETAVDIITNQKTALAYATGQMKQYKLFLEAELKRL